MANVNARRVEEILTSGITAGHYVAGSNITITENQDGTETIASTGGGGGGTTDYSDLTNKPSINSVTLSGNKTTSDLGIDEVPDVTSIDNGKILKASYSGSTGSYAWGTLSSTDIINVLSTAQELAINSGIDSNKVSNYNTVVGQMETFYPKLLDVGENAGEITAQDLDNLHFGIYEYLGMFTGSTLPTELAWKTGVVRGYFTQQSMAWNVNFQMVETTDGIFGARTYNGTTWSNWVFNVPGGGGTAPTSYSAPTNNTWTAADIQYSISGRAGGYVVSNNICTVNIRFNLTGTGGNNAGMLNKILFTNLPKPKSGISVALTMNQCTNSSTYSFGAYSTSASLTAAGEIRAPSSIPSTFTGMNYFVISGSYLIDTST